jgi:transcriptional regulator with XRE-family HTH domain
VVKRKDRILNALARRARQLREAGGWTQEVLAERAHMDRSYIAGIEAGLRNPSLKALAKLARGLKVSLSTLVEGVD